MKNNFKRALIGFISSVALLNVGCGSSDDFVFNSGNTGVGFTAPVAQADAFSALGNTPLSVDAANGLLNNDTVNGADATPFNGPTAQGGTVDIAADGSFTYTPAAGFAGQDTFDYTLVGPGGQSTATVTMTSSTLFWYVDNTAGGAGTGTFGAPFNTLAAAVNAAGNGETIFILAGDGSSTGLTGPVTLKPGQTLLGEVVGLDLDDFLPRQIVQPGQRPTLVGPVTVADGCTVEGVRVLGTSTTDGLTGTDVSDLTLTNVTATGDALAFTNGVSVDLDGDVNISECSLGDAFFVVNNNDTATVNSSDSVWARTGGNSVVSARDNASVIVNSTRDSFDVQIDASETATIDTTITNGNGGIPGLTASVDATCTGTISDSNLGGVDVLRVGSSQGDVSISNCQIAQLSITNNQLAADGQSTVTVTGGLVASLTLDAAGTGYMRAIFTGTSSGLGGFWQQTSTDTGTSVLSMTDCEVSDYQGSEGATATTCLDSFNSDFNNVDFFDMMDVVDLANFGTANNVSGVYTPGTAQSVVACPNP